jgi:hypothetical protein
MRELGMRGRWSPIWFAIGGLICGLAVSAMVDWSPFSAEVPKSGLVFVWIAPALVVGFLAALAAIVRDRFS